MDDREYDFALIIDGVSELTPAIEENLFAAGCDDATFSSRDGCVYVEFSRNGADMEQVVASAIHDVQTANIYATAQDHRPLI